MKNIAILLFFICFVYSYDLGIYPKAKDGFVQKIVNLEPKDNEDEYRVEIYFGKNVLVDCNYHFLIGGKLEELNLKGWGYKYYEFDGENEMAGTLMACANEKKQNKFVTYQTVLKPRYNSKLPIVLYVKKGIDINVKIFKEIESEIR